MEITLLRTYMYFLLKYKIRQLLSPLSKKRPSFFTLINHMIPKLRDRFFLNILPSKSAIFDTLVAHTLELVFIHICICVNKVYIT